MEHRQIGDLSVSLLGLGCNNFGNRIDEPTSTAVVRAALDRGITYFDTADSYGDGRSEEILGRALGPDRERVVIASKFGVAQPDDGLTGGHPVWVRRAVEHSLRRLGVDYIDHYQLHAPDPDVPLDDTMGALHDLVQEGKVLELGCSNFDAALLAEAATIATRADATPFRTVQNRSSVLHRDPERTLDACRRLGMGFIPYYPLESGLLTGKVAPSGEPPAGTRLATMPAARRAEFVDDARLAAVQRLSDHAAGQGRTLLELAFGWLLSDVTVVSVIAGASNVEQVEHNAASIGWRMSADERRQVAALAG